MRHQVVQLLGEEQKLRVLTKTPTITTHVMVDDATDLMK
jgi:hypothetical protein